jgi:hypothetical protein
MGIVDFLLRNQWLTVPAVAMLLYLPITAFLRWWNEPPPALGFPPLDSGDWFGIDLPGTRYSRRALPEGEQVEIGVLPPVPAEATLLTLSRRRRRVLGALLVLGLAAVGLMHPIPLAAGLPLPQLSRDEPTNKSLLIFIHGWNGDPVDTWQRFPRLAIEDPALKAFNILVVNYPTYYVKRNLDVETLARWLDDGFARDGVYRRYENIWIVAHSMGGIIARHLAVINRNDRDAPIYRGLVEIATPHDGAQVAKLASEIGVSEGFLDELHPGSRYLARLRDNFQKLKGRPATYCLASIHDGTVSENSARVPCDDGLTIQGWSHKELVKPNDRSDERYGIPIAYVKTMAASVSKGGP